MPLLLNIRKQIIDNKTLVESSEKPHRPAPRGAIRPIKGVIYLINQHVCYDSAFNTIRTSILLRILLWKLGFEWANLLRLLRPQDDRKIYYFAFGANLSPDILQERCMTIYESFDYILEDAALCFTQSGFYKDHGFASADHAPGERVYGKMYLIRQSDALRMDYYEGVPFLKAHDKVTGDYQGSPFYYYRARVTAENLKPTEQYLGYITVAYRQMDCVPKDYVEAMEATETLEHFEPQTLTGKFVKDIERWPAIFHPVLIRYESACQRLVEVFWNTSCLAWMIKP